MSKNCIPNFTKISQCMESNANYREYLLQNSYQNFIESQDQEEKRNFSSYDRELNYFEPKVQLDTFFKCSKDLFEKCKEK